MRDGANEEQIPGFPHRRIHDLCDTVPQTGQMRGHPVGAQREGYDGATRAVVLQRKGQSP